VKEFILKAWTSNQPYLKGSALTETDQMILDQRVESLEAFILDICIRYLLLHEIGNTDLFSEEQVAIAELPQEFDLFNDNKEPAEYDPYCTWESYEENTIRYDPTDRGFGEFFVYASCHWLEHFGAIAVEPLPSLASIEKLCQAGSTRLLNWIQQNCRPDCAIQPRFQFVGSLYDPLSITSLYGSEAMLRYMLENSDFDKDKFLRNPGIGAADQVLQWGDVSRLSILFLDDKVGHQLQNLDFFRLVIKTWSHPITNGHDWDLAFDLVDYVSDKLVQEQWGNELLCVAAGAGCMPMIRRLMTSAQYKAELRSELLREFRYEQQRSAFGKRTHQSIGEAVMGNHVAVVEYLLGENGIEAHLQYRNSRRENVLHLASRLCNPEMFRLLIPRFQEGIHQADDQGDTALVRIIMNSSASRNRYESARILLLQPGADRNSHSWDGQQDPLRAAVQLGDLDMCCLLISIGNMNPLSALACDSEGQMGLKDRTPENEGNMLQILQLLCTHANIASTSAHS
jgi:ankyrin repeat protein